MTNSFADKSLPPKQIMESKYSSQALFSGKQEIQIEHAGHTYRLRITRQNKLILTK
jgi:hemin uptake protein HemP